MISIKGFCVAALALCAGVSAAPQATPTSSAAATPTPTYGLASKNLIYAQQLVYNLLAKYGDLSVVGIHGIPPSAGPDGNGTTIAINLDRIGKPDDSDDDAVAVDHKTILAPNAADPTKFEIAIPMYNAGGQRLNASINLVFAYTYGDSILALHGKATAYRDEVARNLTSYKDLFTPIKSFNLTKCTPA